MQLKLIRVLTMAALLAAFIEALGAPVKWA